MLCSCWKSYFELRQGCRIWSCKLGEHHWASQGAESGPQTSPVCQIQCVSQSGQSRCSMWHVSQTDCSGKLLLTEPALVNISSVPKPVHVPGQPQKVPCAAQSQSSWSKCNMQQNLAVLGPVCTWYLLLCIPAPCCIQCMAQSSYSGPCVAHNAHSRATLCAAPALATLGCVPDMA